MKIIDFHLHTIASDTRFKAATSGASISDILGGYGNDQYSSDYEAELGVPWLVAELGVVGVLVLPWLVGFHRSLEHFLASHTR